ncbi:YxeA family protein [Bacillus nitratireducens]|uniref:YxeA family protein n=1 Tax=Bacillus nitratireducens TaxID=2026193 RepID=UPI0039BF8773
MKQIMLMFSVFVMFTVFLSGCNLNRLGTDKNYVQITKDGEQLKEKNVNGDTTYQYKLSGIDKDGKEKEMEFTALKNLRKEAFLLIYYSEEKGVKSWEEVKKEELPKKVKEKLKVN